MHERVVAKHEHPRTVLILTGDFKVIDFAAPSVRPARNRTRPPSLRTLTRRTTGRLMLERFGLAFVAFGFLPLLAAGAGVMFNMNGLSMITSLAAWRLLLYAIVAMSVGLILLLRAQYRPVAET